jgi:A/G-specific adenine glycosylase
MSELAKPSDRIPNAGDFRRTLIDWGEQHFRSFSWRRTDDPYRILMAEILLHRTQASQVSPIYDQFIVRYPNSAILAASTVEELHQALYSLGLRWRIDRMHEMAIDLVARYDGNVPAKKVDLLSLAGVSDYIAGAVRCFAWNIPEPLIDTNTVRVVGRLFGLEAKDSSRRNRYFRELIESLVDPIKPRVYNYAILDLADQICTKKRSPQCYRCPVRRFCTYGAAVELGLETELSNDDVDN